MTATTEVQHECGHFLERMTEPDRIIIFRVPWEDDQGNIRTNRAWRVLSQVFCRCPFRSATQQERPGGGGMIDFKGRHFEKAIILWGVRGYVAYPLAKGKGPLSKH